MTKLILLLASAIAAQASVFPISLEIVSSNFGVSGTGSYANDIFVHFGLDQYDTADVALPNLHQPTYFRYSYTFATISATAVESFTELVVGLPADCATDPECIFGVQTGGAQFDTHPIAPYVVKNGPTMHGVKLDAFSPASTLLTVSFFSNRVPGGEGRIYVAGDEDYFITDIGLAIAPNLRALPQTEPPAQTPEPVTTALIASGLASGVIFRLRRNRG